MPGQKCIFPCGWRKLQMSASQSHMLPLLLAEGEIDNACWGLLGFFFDVSLGVSGWFISIKLITKIKDSSAEGKDENALHNSQIRSEFSIKFVP